MFVRVVPLSQPSSRGLLYVKCLCGLSRYHSPVDRGLLYVKCLCELSRLSQPSGRGLLYVKCLCELSRYHSPVVEVCCMLRVFASCPAITAQ